MGSISVFEHACIEMTASRQWREPESFQGYLEKNGITKARTAEKLSVQSLDGLDPFLRKSGIMVFRLGCTLGAATTAFGLIRARAKIEDFFLLDQDIFDNQKRERFIPTASYSELLPFSMFRTINEAGAVNLSIASGLLAHALRLDEPHPRVAPGTGASTYNFKVKPRADLDIIWEHRRGQVEIDSIVAGRRGGKWMLFVIESKHGSSGSLSKAKLAYSMLALASQEIPGDFDLVPVYMRSSQDGQIINFDIAECSLDDPRHVCPAVDTLSVARVVRLSLKLDSHL